MISPLKLVNLAGIVLVPASLVLGGGDKHRNKTPSAEGSADSQQIQKNDRTAQAQAQQVPDGFVLIEERIVYLMADQPQQHFASAVANMSQNNPQAAAGELRVAADYLEMQASRAKDKQALKDASQQLQELVGRVESGEVKSADEMSRIFADANLALAKLGQSKAEKALKQNDFVAAGHELENAASSFRQALVWRKQDPKPEQLNAIQTASTIAANLMNERMSLAEESGQSASESSQASGQSAAAPGEAQQASAQQSPEEQGSAQEGPGAASPLLGTTPAEAENIAQHAQQAAETLGQQIEQLTGDSPRSGPPLEPAQKANIEYQREGAQPQQKPTEIQPAQ